MMSAAAPTWAVAIGLGPTSGGGAALATNAPASNASGTSFNTVNALQVTALGRRPLATVAERSATMPTPASRMPSGPETPTLGPAFSTRPTTIADVLNSAETYAIQPTAKPKLGPNAARAHTYGPPSSSK